MPRVSLPLLDRLGISLATRVTRQVACIGLSHLFTITFFAFFWLYFTELQVIQIKSVYVNKNILYPLMSQRKRFKCIFFIEYVSVFTLSKICFLNI